MKNIENVYSIFDLFVFMFTFFFYTWRKIDSLMAYDVYFLCKKVHTLTNNRLFIENMNKKRQLCC